MKVETKFANLRRLSSYLHGMRCKIESNMAENRQSNCRNSVDASHFFVATGIGPGYIRLNSMIPSASPVHAACEIIEPRPHSTDCNVRPNSSLAGVVARLMEERKWALAVEDAVNRI